MTGTLMRIAIPLLAGKEWMGGYRYVRTLARALHRAHVPIWLVPSGADDFGSTLEKDGERVHRYAPSPTLVRKAGHVIGHRNLAIERAAVSVHADLVFPTISSLGPRTSVPFVGWISDFQHLDLPQLFTPAARRSRNRAMRRIAVEARHVILSSEHAMRRYVDWFPRQWTQATVLHFPASVDPRRQLKPPGEVVERYGLEQPFVYLPNQFWVHKNHEVAFRAWALLGTQAPLLVCSGHEHDPRRPHHFAELRQMLVEAGVQDRVRFLGLVPRDDQINLFRAASVVLNPSRYEGWSTTVEEARSLGKRLLLSDIPVFREQAPPDSTFFHVDRPDELATAIRELSLGYWGFDASQERRALRDSEIRFDMYVQQVERIISATRLT